LLATLLQHTKDLSLASLLSQVHLTHFVVSHTLQTLSSTAPHPSLLEPYLRCVLLQTTYDPQSKLSLSQDFLLEVVKRAPLNSLPSVCNLILAHPEMRQHLLSPSVKLIEKRVGAEEGAKAEGAMLMLKVVQMMRANG
jgi:hypothetical protein